ncbi:relaxase domain-containing protein [Nocardia sp. CA-151230]|uniref:relaxase domain-containing protein n=1 Tax=Nocardia sp. CA-151230 TaxID=3239982 RepID=UPI003D94EA5F
MGCVTATLHKVLAGNGYLYYLRHVTAHDSADRGPGTLSDYYSARGESPRRWDGSGLASLGLADGSAMARVCGPKRELRASAAIRVAASSGPCAASKPCTAGAAVSAARDSSARATERSSGSVMIEVRGV